MTIRLAIICGYIEIPTIFHLKMSEGKEQRMFPKLHKQSKQNNLIFESYEAMTKEELIQALIQARITEARLKKVTK